MTRSFLDGPRPRAFAHRGGGEEAEENTMAAFARAAALGYRYIETDVQASRDGIAVVLHDPDFRRLYRRPERVGALGWQAIRAIRSPRGEAPPRLDDVLAAFPGIRFNIDPKTDAAIIPLADAIRRTGAEDRVCIGGFDARRTRAVLARIGRPVCWSPARGGVARLWSAGWGLPAGTLPFACIQIPERHRGIPLATPRLLAAARARGIEVHVWTVDEAPDMERLLDLGIDGIMTGRPARLRRVMERRGCWTGDQGADRDLP